MTAKLVDGPGFLAVGDAAKDNLMRGDVSHDLLAKLVPGKQDVERLKFEGLLFLDVGLHARLPDKFVLVQSG